MQRDEYSDPPVYGEDFRDCSISIDDDDNPLLTENEGSDGEDDEADAGAGIELYRSGDKIDLTRNEWEAALRTFQELGWEPEVAFERYLMTPTFIKHDEGDAMKEAGALLWAMFDQTPALTLSLDLDVDLFVQLARMLSDTIRYLELNADSMPDYGECYRAGRRISTGFVESAVNEIVAKRMVKKQQMRWNRFTVQSFLNVRIHVLNGTLEDAFRHWHKGFRPVAGQTKLAPAA